MAPERVDDAHVFVVLGDVGRVASDDVLIPTDDRHRVTAGFEGLVRDALVTAEAEDADGTPAVDSAYIVDRPAPGVALLDGEGPRRWLVQTVATRVEDLIDRVTSFTDAVARHSEVAPARNGRAKPLIAMPLVGTGEGGASERRGEVIVALLPRLRELALEHDRDFALVLSDPRDYSAAQEVRRRSLTSWPLPEHLVDRADALGKLALEGRLALFVGSGVGRAAGLPVWAELLDGLADRGGVTDEERDELHQLAPPDAAEVLRRRLGDERLRQELRSVFDRREYALAHGLLAALPVTETVTTNYDRLLEIAYTAAGKQVRLLPGPSLDGPPGSAGPWLVKLHGDVERPEDIVLTRESYLRLMEEQSALAGVVPTLLLTRHVLFVGFSLLDDTFIRAAHQARRVLQRAVVDGAPAAVAGHDAPSVRPVGTALGLREQLRLELWSADLDHVTMSEPGSSSLDAAARRLELFLDRLAFSTAPLDGWLLDERYASLRDDDDETLVERLQTFLDSAAQGASASRGWSAVEELILRLGGSPPREGGSPPAEA